MAVDRLVNVLAVGPLNPGASQTIAHGIKREGSSKAPRFVMPDRITGIGVAAISATQITFTNNGAAPGDTANFYVELEHTIQRLAAGGTAFSWRGGGLNNTMLNPTPIALTSSGGSIAVDLTRGCNFGHTFTESTTLAAPTGMFAGQVGTIVFTQVSPAKTLAFNAAWNFLNAGAPTISVTAGKLLMVSFYSPDGAIIIAASIQDT